LSRKLQKNGITKTALQIKDTTDLRLHTFSSLKEEEPMYSVISWSLFFKKIGLHAYAD